MRIKAFAREHGKMMTIKNAGLFGPAQSVLSVVPENLFSPHPLDPETGSHV
jgi:hypothetical protein